jgi:hypothetical protein
LAKKKKKENKTKKEEAFQNGNTIQNRLKSENSSLHFLVLFMFIFLDFSSRRLQEPLKKEGEHLKKTGDMQFLCNIN